MIERVRKGLVDSWVGAIALGYLLAQSVLHIAYVIIAPFASWITRNQYRGMAGSRDLPQGFMLMDSVPELIKSICLLLLWYVLFWWLYLKAPAGNEPSEPVADRTSTPEE